MEYGALYAVLFSSFPSFSFVVLRCFARIRWLQYDHLYFVGNAASADVCSEFSFSVSFLPQLVFSAALALRYRNAVLLNEIRLKP